MMDLLNINDNAFAAAANGLLLWLSCILLIVMANYIRTKVAGVTDVLRRARRSADPTFQGGVYDVAIAMGTIALGLVIRTETTWEFRVFPTELRPLQMVVGSAIIAMGVLCLVRLLTPAGRFQLYFWLALGSAIVFTVATYEIADWNWPELD